MLSQINKQKIIYTEVFISVLFNSESHEEKLVVILSFIARSKRK